MRFSPKHAITRAIAVTALFCMCTQSTFASLLVLANQPLFIGANVPPQVMLAISKDQQLYKKAYNDYSDLDGDGQIETTYKHSIDYYGYFDPTKCYVYNNGQNRFEPVSVSADKYCSGQWSGNFLNWVSTTRMDAVRKLLYGGMRSTDTLGTTVLERAYLPTDAHAFAKYYNGPDIAQLTPFNPPTTPAVFFAITGTIPDVCGAISPTTTAPFATVLSRFPTVSPLGAIPFQVPPILTPITSSGFGPCTPTPGGSAGLASGSPPTFFTYPGHIGIVASSDGAPSVYIQPAPIPFTTAAPVSFSRWDIDVPFTVDPIKATVITPGLDVDGAFAPQGIPAAVVTKYLAEHGIIVEKTGLYSFFIMFTIGITKGRWNTMVTELQQFKDDYDKNQPLWRVLPEFLRAHPAYEKKGLRDLCDEIHAVYRDNDIARLTTDMYLSEMVPAMTPAAAYAKMTHWEVERVPIDALEGRVSAVLLTPYPPGIPLLIPGERVNARIVNYLKFAREFNGSFPGFETDIHGLVKQKTGGNVEYFLDCVRG